MIRRSLSTLRGDKPSVSYLPGPRSRYPGTLLLAFLRDSLGLVTRMAREYGDIAHATLGWKHLYLLNHPDDVRDVLVSSLPPIHRACIPGLQAPHR